MIAQVMPPATEKPRRTPARGLLAGVALAAFAALAAGCSNTASTVDMRDYDYRLRHPVMISEEPEVLDLPVGMNGPAMSAEIEGAVNDYVAQYRAQGTGAITIQVPTGSANEVAAASTGRAVHYALVRDGVPHGRIRVAPYAVNDRTRVAPLRMSFLRVKATVPSCGVWPDSNTPDYRNEPYHDFGCAQTSNLAAMVANPADLVRPQPLAPSHGGRRAKVINDYAGGAETRSNNTLIDSGTGG